MTTDPGRAARIVIVGASLAGLRAAEELRREGFAGSLTLVGDEPQLPYDRTPLTKGVLSGRLTPQSTQLVADDLDVDWVLGVPAVALDRANHQVVLADGREVAYDRVLISTGRRARPWHHAGEAALSNVLTLRTRADAADLRGRLTRRPGRVLVIGAGFIGSEVASSCRDLGVPVTVVDRADVPLQAALGQAVGTAVADLQRRHGVDLRMGTSVTGMADDGMGCVRQVHLDDGTTVDVDVVVVAVGSLANTEWLAGSGLSVDPGGGVACDGTLRVFTVDAVPDGACYAAGDVAQVPHPVYHDQLLAVEHWGTAVDHATIAAHNMISDPDHRRTVTALPRFWSNQFGINIKSVGVPSLADQLVVMQGSVENQRGVLLYGRDGTSVAAVALNAPRELEAYAALIETRTPFPPPMTLPDWYGGSAPKPVSVRSDGYAGTSHQPDVHVVGPAPDHPTSYLGLPYPETAGKP